MTLADRLTLARLVLMPLAVAAYLWLPLPAAYWACGWICAAAEISDWLDGKVARARGEVSDFGKLADPFCDVIYRMGVFLAFLLPVGGVGYHLGSEHAWGQAIHVIGVDGHGAPVQGAGLVPWLPVFLMVLRELLAGALRAMTAAKGIVLAARTSGKVKAWCQGLTIIALMAIPAFLGPFALADAAWVMPFAALATWLCAAISVGSLAEYLWVNRAPLRELARAR